MAGALRNCRNLLRPLQQSGRRYFNTKQTAAGYSLVRPLLVGGAVIAGSYGVYKHYSKQQLTEILQNKVVYAASTPDPQPSVFSQTKNHALFLWIHLKPTADTKACARISANLQKYVDAVCPPDMRDEDDEIWAGVGFGPNFFAQAGGKTTEKYDYPHRKSALGELPSSGGEIFIHAKSNNYSKLFELCQKFMSQLPKDSVEQYEDIYSFVYQNGRDLSGFIDGTENSADDESRYKVAVNKQTGGSYVVTQKWVHKLDVIASEKDRTMEGWVGRGRPDSTELSRKPISSHVARMTGGNAFQNPKKFEIVRQSMPYGNVHDKAGLFFIGYAESPKNLEFMLERMVGAGSGGDGVCDDIMRLTSCVKGTYFYFPGAAELKRLG